MKVDIPDSKSRFLADYHRRHRRPLRDYLIGNLEYLIPYLAPLAALYNFTQNNRLMRWFNQRFLHLSDAPLFHPQANANLAAYGATLLKKGEIPAANDKAVIIVQDAFTRYFDSSVFIDLLRFLQAIGIKAYILPYFPNGKPLHVHGFLRRFQRLRKQNEILLQAAAQSGLPLIGLDPAMTLVFRQEYLKDQTAPIKRQILLPQEWLKKHYLSENPALKPSGKRYHLAAHCTEKTQLPSAEKDWQSIFVHFGLELSIIKVGCCGMAGTFGHESEHQNQSKQLFDMSWQQPVSEYGDSLLATGYSCRSQSKRQAQKNLLHPIQVLLQAVEKMQS